MRSKLFLKNPEGGKKERRQQRRLGRRTDVLPQHDYGSVSGKGGSEDGTWEGRAGGGRGGVTGSRSPLASVSHREPKESARESWRRRLGGGRTAAKF